MKLWDYILGTDADLARADRRAFLAGATVLASGLVVPLPKRVFVRRPARTIYVASTFGMAMALSTEAIRRMDLLSGTNDVVDRLQDALGMAREGDTIHLLPGEHQIGAVVLPSGVVMRGDDISLRSGSDFTVVGAMQRRWSTHGTSFSIDTTASPMRKA